MFTGIVESTGRVLNFAERENSWLLEVAAPNSIAAELQEGDSLANNGCCLTLVGAERLSDGETKLSFELLDETVRLTSFDGLKIGSLVNLERPLAAGGRLGGHFVSGHVDFKSSVLAFERRGKNYYLKVSVPEEFIKYVVYKGSIAIDGISLTIAEAHNDGLAVWLIPHTLKVTNLSECYVGKFVNLEFDLLAKYVEKIALGKRDDSPYQPRD